MEYDPIKFRLAQLVSGSNRLRKLFHWLLDLLFLRSWYVRKELWRVRRSIPKSPVILDAGMGFGQYSDRMMGIFHPGKIVGLEIDAGHLYGGEHYFRQVHPQVGITLGDVQILPVAGKSVDLILSVDVMEHIPDDVAAFKEFSRVLKPGGAFIMHTPRDMGEGHHHEEGSDDHGQHWEVDEHFRDGYSDEDITEKLEAEGLTIERIIHDYGPLGRIAWILLQKYPLQMFHHLRLLAIPILLIYMVFVLPVALLAMLLDITRGDHLHGAGILVVARKPAE